MWQRGVSVGSWAACAVLAVAMAFAIPPAHAGTINVILSGFDVSYNGGTGGGALFDLDKYPGGTLTSSQADALKTAVFEYDDNVVDVIDAANDPMYGDLRVDGIGANITLYEYKTDQGSNGGAFGFDWFSNAGYQVRLGLDKVDRLLTPDVFFFTGTATLSLAEQNLPFGLQFTDSQVTFSYTSTRPNGSTSPATSARGSGALTITGEGILVPEPATAGLLLLGVFILGATVSLWRRRGEPGRPGCSM
jgi:hypothetical protein